VPYADPPVIHQGKKKSVASVVDREEKREGSRKTEWRPHRKKKGTGRDLPGKEGHPFFEEKRDLGNPRGALGDFPALKKKILL